MLLKHFFVEKIAHSSYLLACKKTCAVIDPQRDVEVYLHAARELGVTITHILQTHLHADFISGHMDLAGKTGATIYAPKSAQCAFEHVALSEGDKVQLESIRLEILDTPGHTPEHACYVVTDTARGETPIGIFSGDLLFVGDVGRPDLFPGRARELADKLYHSLHDKVMKLPDHCEVYPTHGAGSLCGRAMAAKYQTTIGYERRFNPALQVKDKQAFIQSLTSGMPPAPDHFGRCSEINRRGPVLMADLPPLQELEIAAFEQKLADSGIIVLDIRSYAAFAGLHVPGVWHIDQAGNFPTFAGWVLPTDKDILLVADSFQDAVRANVWARRVGVDRIVGCLNGGMTAWASAGQKIASIHLISAEDLHDKVTGRERFVLVDVRSPSEFADSHIEGAINIPAPELRTRHGELHPQKPTILICSSGNRSSLAASILEQHGFEAVHNVAGGMTGYSAAGYARQCAVCENPHGSRFGDSYGMP